MNKLEELRKVAEAAIPAFERYANREDSSCDVSAIAAFMATSNPQTILALLDLIELQHDVVDDCGYHNRDYFSDRSKALCAYNKFKGNHE